MLWGFVGLVVGIPLLIQGVAALAITPVPNRSLLQYRTGRWGRSKVPDAILVAAAVVAFVMSPMSTQCVVALAVGVYTFVAARWLTHRLAAALTELEDEYLNAASWPALDQHGDKWRYEMKHRFVEAPECVDDITLSLLREHDGYKSFEAALRARRVPSRFVETLNEKQWGLGRPSVGELVDRTLPNEVFGGRGPRSRRMSAEEKFRELRTLLNGPREPLMDRLQYHWTLWGLDFLENATRRAYGRKTQYAALCATVALWFLLSALTDGGVRSSTLILAFGGASLLWLGFVGGSVGVFFLGIFTGTGTFKLDNPCADERYDAVWNVFLSLGVLAFVPTFVGYAVGLPLLLDPSLAMGVVTPDAATVSLAGLCYCLFVLVNHLLTTHALMSQGKDNALARLRCEMAAASDGDERESLVTRFSEVRRLQVWPLGGTTIAQLILGIGAPVIAQLAVVVTGLSKAS